MAPGGKREGAGRPKGVPNKATAEIKELAQKYGPAALKTLSDIAQDDQAPHAARVSASNALLDRGYGRPAQSVEHTGKDGGAINANITVKFVSSY